MTFIKSLFPEKRFLSVCCFFCLILIGVPHYVISQEPPPRPILVTANTSQYLAFGAFYQGNSGGSVIIYSDGSRSRTGDVVLLGMGYNFSAGFYDIVGNRGTLISILDSSATLTGDNGGSMTLQINSITNPPYPVIITTDPPASTQISIGGTLIVGTPLANPPGNYSGIFSVTFVQE